MIWILVTCASAVFSQEHRSFEGEVQHNRLSGAEETENHQHGNGSNVVVEVARVVVVFGSRS